MHIHVYCATEVHSLKLSVIACLRNTTAIQMKEITVEEKTEFLEESVVKPNST